jgi:Na+/proline symporter
VLLWRASLDIYTFAIAISVVIFIAVGVYAGRSVKKLDDYFVAGRQAPTLVIVGTLVASVFSTSIFLVVVGLLPWRSFLAGDSTAAEYKRQLV